MSSGILLVIEDTVPRARVFVHGGIWPPRPRNDRCSYELRKDQGHYRVLEHSVNVLPTRMLKEIVSGTQFGSPLIKGFNFRQGVPACAPQHLSDTILSLCRKETTLCTIRVTQQAEAVVPRPRVSWYTTCPTREAFRH